VQTQACNSEACPIDCVGSWSEYNACSHSCGPDGTQSRTYSVTTAAEHGGAACPVRAGEFELRACNTQIMCPVNCEGGWASWGACSLTCGGGTQTRPFSVSDPAQHGGLCPDAGQTQSQDCNTQECPIDCVGDYGDDTAWSACPVTCGGGVQTRPYVVSAAAQFGGTCALDGTTESQDCNTAPCPLDCEGAYTAWSTCTETCGGGTQTRSFAVTVAAANGGQCPHEGDVQTQACNSEACPIDCVGSWSEYNACSHSCGPDGTQSRTYSVTTAAEHGGAACPVAAGASDTQTCNTNIGCPVDCEGYWGNWGTCSAACGEGTQTRAFVVTTPAANGGSCPDLDGTESRACLEAPCSTPEEPLDPLAPLVPRDPDGGGGDDTIAPDTSLEPILENPDIIG